ncbi:MAG: hypothetical protein F4023_09230 [Acidobacteria bacterium]|nr:hypothetical protein [Acidobacteriota bacterium]MYK79818.1 hypothetical protein [Acidobacteriota bacterium]
MTESKWGKVKDNTVPVLLGTLIVAMFYSTASTHGRIADMENRLGERVHRLERELSDRINGVGKRLSDRITRLETLMEIHLAAHSTQAAPRAVR